MKIENCKFTIYGDDEEKKLITQSLNVSLRQLDKCITKEKSDRWVWLIKDWFDVAKREYPHRMEQILEIEPQVMTIVEKIKDNYILNAAIVPEKEEIGNPVWWKNTWELIWNFNSMEDLEKLDKRVDELCTQRMYNEFNCVLIGHKDVTPRIRFTSEDFDAKVEVIPIPHNLQDRAREILIKMKTKLS